MGRPHDVAKILQEGRGPAEIARRLGITIGSVRQYLWIAIGEGLIRRSDVLFSLPRQLRTAADNILRQDNPETALDLHRLLIRERIPCDREEVNILWNLTVCRVGHGDLYEFITSTEELLHRKVRQVLKAQFGDQESGWWRKGVPESVRVACAAAREKGDDDDVEPYAYTTLIHLKEILERQWPLFVAELPKSISQDRKVLLRDVERLNAVRNRVMHPTRLHKVTDEDFEFAREMHRKLRLEAWESSRNLLATANDDPIQRSC